MNEEQKIFERGCEGQKYKRHTCFGPFAWNHVLINKAKFRGVPKKFKKYFDQRINLSRCCQWFHNQHGETTAFREWFKKRQIFIYGRAAVEKFFRDSPQKIKERI